MNTPHHCPYQPPPFYSRVIADGSLGPYWLDLVREHGIIFQFWLVMKPRVFLADTLNLKEIVSDFKGFRKVRSGVGFFDRYADSYF